MNGAIIIVVFLLGAAAGAILVSFWYVANLSRIKREFQAALESDLQATVEADLARKRTMNNISGGTSDRAA